jgi:hypothetical protein
MRRALRAAANGVYSTTTQLNSLLLLFWEHALVIISCLNLSVAAHSRSLEMLYYEAKEPFVIRYVTVVKY